MGDDLGDDWWEENDTLGASQGKEDNDVEKAGKERVEEVEQPKEKPSEPVKTRKKRKGGTEKMVTPEDKSALKSQEECFLAQKEDEEVEEKPKKKRRRKKKTISDVLAMSEPKPGCPGDLRNLVLDHFKDTRSVIELEELTMPDSCFLASNDLTHSVSSYLKEICPKWAKVKNQHTEKSSVVLLIVCSSALRAIEIIKHLTTFKGDAKVIKLFARHIKIEEQVKLLQKGVTHVGVGTPGRISALIEKESLTLSALRFLVLDWNWRDQKQRRMVDINEVKGDLLKLLQIGIIKACREEKLKVGLF